MKKFISNEWEVMQHPFGNPFLGIEYRYPEMMIGLRDRVRRQMFYRRPGYIGKFFSALPKRYRKTGCVGEVYGGNYTKELALRLATPHTLKRS